MPLGATVTPPPGASHVLPPSFERWITWPNQPLDCEAYSRLRSAGEPYTCSIAQPVKNGPATSHFSRLPSDVRINAPLRVPTSTRTLLISGSFLNFVYVFPAKLRTSPPAGVTAILHRHKVRRPQRTRGGLRPPPRVFPQPANPPASPQSPSPAGFRRCPSVPPESAPRHRSPRRDSWRRSGSSLRAVPSSQRTDRRSPVV